MPFRYVLPNPFLTKNKYLIKNPKNRNIKLINYELSSIRKGIFNETLGYFSFNNKYNSKQFKNNYLSLKNENINILSRREIENGKIGS